MHVLLKLPNLVISDAVTSTGSRSLNAHLTYTKSCMPPVGVNHKGGGDESSEFGVGTLMQIVPSLNFVIFQNCNHQIACITMP